MKKRSLLVAVLLAAISIAATVPLSSLTDTYNDSSKSYCSFCWSINGSSYAPGSRTMSYNVASSEIFGLDPGGKWFIQAPATGSWIIGFGAGAGILLSANATSWQLGSPTITFGAVNNPGLNKISLTGAAIGSTSGCGSSPTLSTNASDFMGSITAGSGAGTCTINFSGTKSSAPNCIVENQTDATVPTGIAPTTGALVFTSVASKTYVWMCNDKA